MSARRCAAVCVAGEKCELTGEGGVTMEQARENSVVVVSLSLLCVVVALACALTIGAISVLVLLEVGKQAPIVSLPKDAPTAGGAGLREPVFRGLPAPREGECRVVMWKAGTIYCVRGEAPQGSEMKRARPGVAVQALTNE